METVMWFKMFLFLIVIGTFMSLVNAGGLPPEPTFPVLDPNPAIAIVQIAAAGVGLGLTLVGFFTGLGTLLGIGTTPILPAPFSWILAVVIVIMWVFLIFEVIKTVAKSVLP